MYTSAKDVKGKPDKTEDHLHLNGCLLEFIIFWGFPPLQGSQLTHMLHH